MHKLISRKSMGIWVAIAALVLALALPAGALAMSGDSYEPDGTFDTAKVLSLDGSSQERTLDPGSDRDNIKIAAVAGEPVLIELNRETFGHDSYVEIFDNSRRRVDERSWWMGEAKIIVTPMKTGWMYIVVQNYEWSEYAHEYTISAHNFTPSTISGTIQVEDTFEPVDQCEVALYGEYTYMWDDGYDSGTETWWEWQGWGMSDASGAYEISDLTEGNYRLGFHSWANPDYVSEYYDDQSLFDNADTIALAEGEDYVADALLGLAGVLSGEVTDEVSGDPIPGVFVQAWEYIGTSGYYYAFDGWDLVAEDYTGLDGGYTLGGLNPDVEYKIQYFDGSRVYTSEWYDESPDIYGAEALQLAAGEVRFVDEDLSIDPSTGAIVGSVYDRIDGSPIEGIWVGAIPVSAFSGYDMSGYAMSGYDMSGYDMSGYLDFSGYQTWANGSYRIGGLAAGEQYKLLFSDIWMSGYLPQWWNDQPDPLSADTITIQGGEKFTADAWLDRDPNKGFITGRVVDDETGDPIEGAWIHTHLMSSYDMSGYWGGWYEAFSDADGNYRMRGVPAEKAFLLHAFSWDDPEYLEWWFDGVSSDYAATPLTFAPGEVREVGIALRKAAYLEGTVTDEVSGLGIEQVGIELYEQFSDGNGGMSSYWAGQAYTDENGAYDLGYWLDPASTYTLVFMTDEAPGYQSEVYDNVQHMSEATPLTLAAGTNVIDAELARTAEASTLTGLVKDQWGNAAPRVVVDVYMIPLLSGYDAQPAFMPEPTPVDWTASTVTDSAGGFIFPTLDSRVEYKLQFSDPFGRYFGECYLDKGDLDSADGIALEPGGARAIEVQLQTILDDETKPTATDNAVSLYDDLASIVITATDTMSGVASITYSLDGALDVQVNAASTTVTTAGIGEHSLVYLATDKAGNVSESSETTFAVRDTIAPGVSSNAQATYPESATITLEASDAGSGVSYIGYVLDGETTVTVSSTSASVGTTTLGAHTLVFWAVDAAGNESDKVDLGFTVLDVTAPQVSHNVKVEYMGTASILISASDGGSGVEAVGYSLDGGAVQTVGGASTTVVVNTAGTHEIVCWARDQASNVTTLPAAPFTVVPLAQKYTPVAQANRFGTSTDIAQKAFPGWVGVEHVVIASGADRAMADPLAAAGLAGVYDAPLLLVAQNDVPWEVKSALDAMPDGIQIHVIGGPMAVPQSILSALSKVPGVASVERLPYGDRYQTAAAVARRMKTVLEAKGSSLPATALIANGENPASFFDALAMSPISARQHFPVLLVQQNALPSATSAVLGDLGLSSRVIAGGPKAVSDAVASKLGAERWYGRDRYATAQVIGDKAMAKGWLTGRSVGVAASLSDALTGGTLVGRSGGCLIVTPRESLCAPAAQFLSKNKGGIENCYVFGGSSAVSVEVRIAIDNILK